MPIDDNSGTSRKDLTAALSGLGLVIGLIAAGATGMLPWYRVPTLIGIVTALAAAALGAIRLHHALRKRRRLEPLQRELEALLFLPEQALLDLQGLDLGVFVDGPRHIFCSTELSEEGVHWVDVLYFQMLQVFCRHGFTPHVMLTDDLENTRNAEEKRRRTQSIQSLMKALAGRKGRVHTIDGETVADLPMRDLFVVLDETSRAMYAEHEDERSSVPRRASKSLLWSTFLVIWLRSTRKAPIIKLQWAATAHRYDWLRQYGCHFAYFPHLDFVSKPEGPYLKCWNWTRSLEELVGWLRSLTAEHQEAFACQLAMVTSTVNETWLARSTGLQQNAEAIRAECGEFLQLFSCSSAPSDVATDDVRGRLGWLLGHRLHDIGLAIR